jgi:lambda family phage portal protein
MDRSTKTDGGNRVRQSVEFDAAGRRVAYHVLADHPGESPVLGGVHGLNASRRLAAEDASLAFRSIRVGQVRGLPWPVSVVGTIRQEDAFQEAYILLARSAACVALFFKNGAKHDGPLVAGGEHESPIRDAATGEPIDAIEPGMMGLLPDGVEPDLLATNLPPPSFEMVERILLRRIAGGLSISYAALARDYTNATFSATRAEQLEDRKAYRPVQEFVFNRHTLPFYRRWLRWSIALGDITLTDAQRRRFIDDPASFCLARPVYPGWEWVNPHQEAQAAEVELRLGMVSLPTIAASKGRDWKDELSLMFEAERYWHDERKRLGLPELPFMAAASAKPADAKPGDDGPDDADGAGDDGAGDDDQPDHDEGEEDA